MLASFTDLPLGYKSLTEGSLGVHTLSNVNLLVKKAIGIFRHSGFWASLRLEHVSSFVVTCPPYRRLAVVVVVVSCPQVYKPRNVGHIIGLSLIHFSDRGSHLSAGLPIVRSGLLLGRSGGSHPSPAWRPVLQLPTSKLERMFPHFILRTKWTWLHL